MFKAQAGVYMVHIPTPAADPAQLACSPARSTSIFDNLATASANIKAGKLKALAVTTARRSSAMPDVPTIAEAGAKLGLARFDIDTWFGIFGPAQLPAESRRHAQPGVRRRPRVERAEVRAWPTLYAEPMPMTPERFAAFVKAELAKYEALVKASGARVE